MVLRRYRLAYMERSVCFEFRIDCSYTKFEFNENVFGMRRTLMPVVALP